VPHGTLDCLRTLNPAGTHPGLLLLWLLCQVRVQSKEYNPWSHNTLDCLSTLYPAHTTPNKPSRHSPWASASQCTLPGQSARSTSDPLKPTASGGCPGTPAAHRGAHVFSLMSPILCIPYVTIPLQFEMQSNSRNMPTDRKETWLGTSTGHACWVCRYAVTFWSQRMSVSSAHGLCCSYLVQGLLHGAPLLNLSGHHWVPRSVLNQPVYTQ
jgi:hypothetical protein